MDVLITDSDWETESGSSEDQEDINFLYDGQAQSILSSLEESIGKIDDFLSFERAFTHGDVVCSITNPSGQMGKVTSVDLFVDLENVHGKIFKNVNSKNLLKIRSISESDYVIQGPWVGRVDKVVDKVTVVFDDGAKCEVTALENEKLLPVAPNFLEDSQYPYYPGQRVQVKLSTTSKSSRWLCGSWRESQDEGTVCAVEAGLVYVNWLASALNDFRVSMPAPPCLQDSKNLTLLSCLSHANWQLGDWCILPTADRKVLMEQIFVSPSTVDLIKEHKKIERGSKRRNLRLNFEEILIIVKTKTKVDVVWQDGTSSFGLDSQTVLPVNVINAHEFWPGQFVLEKGATDDLLNSSSQRWGVVQSVDAKERTVKVQWETIPMTQADNLAGDRKEEIVSAYELIEHPDFAYCFGDIVFKADEKQYGYHADKDLAKSIAGFNVGVTLKDMRVTDDQNELPNKCYLSRIGNVIGFIDGAVEVRWANGSTIKVAPYEILRVDKCEGSTVTPASHEANVVELIDEMTERESQSSSQRGQGLLSFNGDEGFCEKHPWESSSFLFPRAAIGFFSSIKASIFQSLGVTSLPGEVSSVHISKDENESAYLIEKEIIETCNPCCESHSTTELQSIENNEKPSPNEVVVESQERIDLSLSVTNDLSEQFKRFDVKGDCLDHHFFDAGKRLALSQVERSWVKKVQQEWSILENNLPETIYVRVFEERMDLLQAAIVGAPGTPYHDGLFFFDIFFPPQYPYEPPMVHYHSNGLRINPNLYESGKVCLSLLNTWTGTGTEVWNPGSSTILQVLLSLQALVLNEKPYFNEAGYDKQMGIAEGEKNSVSYNENALLVTCKSMLYLIRKPPKHFEELVEEHFSRRTQYILLACKAYLEGAPIGCAFGSEGTEHENQNGTSTGFKIMLAKLFPKLVEAFSDKGIDCSQFIELQK
ncbi:Ubiquitin-conjugating enzyme [Quillaja saponaria]|uniref:E2 ubiquitin-conjugating enzyme n=1 Tax=Quillaja saponaria TaxID=32244 RepID=A0AAD7PUD4_QUISA|nr:Ubiquitin-conjugating enzyme [Quillaja saponaria]